MKRIYNWNEYRAILESQENDISEEAKTKMMYCCMFVRKNHPLWNNLLNLLAVEENRNLPYKTMATDGFKIYYDPEFVMEKTASEIIWVIIHEIMHNVLGHFLRKMPNQQYWNAACDYALNLTIDPKLPGNQVSGKSIVGTMPEGALFDPKFKGLRAEEIYDYLLTNQVVLPPEAGWNYGGVLPAPPPGAKNTSGGGGGGGGSTQPPKKFIRIGDYVMLPNNTYGEVEDIDPSGNITVKPISSQDLIDAIENETGKKVEIIY
jgi:hypothetical protein